MSSEHDQTGIPVPFRPLFVEVPPKSLARLRRVTKFYPDYLFHPDVLNPLHRAELAARMAEFDRDPRRALDEVIRMSRAAEVRRKAQLERLNRQPK